MLYAHPAVRLAAVVGVPDVYRGEVVAAFVAPKEGYQVHEGELLAFCRTRLSTYKVRLFNSNGTDMQCSAYLFGCYSEAAFVYHEGDLHSPRRTAPTRLIRLEGMNLNKVQRLRYEPV